MGTNHCFPLIRPAIKPLFLRGGTWPGGGGWLISHEKSVQKKEVVHSDNIAFFAMETMETWTRNEDVFPIQHGGYSS